MLLCRTSVDNNVRDSFLRSKTVANVDKLNIGEILQKMEAKITELADRNVVEALKMTQEKVEKHTHHFFIPKSKIEVVQCSD